MASAFELAQLIQRLENVACKLESSLGRKVAPIMEEEVVSASVLALDDVLGGPFAAYLGASLAVGGDVAKHADLVKLGVTALRNVVLVASRSKKPLDSDLLKLLAPIADSIQSIQSFWESNRRSNFFNHLSAINESIPALGWITVSPAPGPYIKEMNDAGQFYTNRVIKDWKEKDKTHVDWVRSWIQFLTELQAYVKQHHTTGLTWNAKGGDAVENAAKSSGAVSSDIFGATPPPTGPSPPPPMPAGKLFLKETKGAEESRTQLLAALKRDEGVSAGLKKVTADMQTHKNPSLRANSTVPAQSNITPRPRSSAAPSKPVVERLPRMELDGRKWIVEYQKYQSNLVIGETAMNQVVYIFKCEGSTVQVKGKVNSIVLDSCKKTNIVLDSVVSSVEFVNCQSVQMQVLVKVPTIAIDKTDGCQIYLNAESLDLAIVSAKSSEMNVMVLKDGDFVEYPIPEQFKTTYNGNGLTTVTNESA